MPLCVILAHWPEQDGGRNSFSSSRPVGQLVPGGQVHCRQKGQVHLVRCNHGCQHRTEHAVELLQLAVTLGVVGCFAHLPYSKQVCLLCHDLTLESPP